MLIAIYLASLTRSWWIFCFCYAVLFPAGIGINYWTPFICAWEYFPERKGLVSGLISAGFGFGAFIFGFLTTALVNPKDVRAKNLNDGTGSLDMLYTKDIADKVPGMIRTCL